MKKQAVPFILLTVILLAGEQPPLKPKPLNLWRRFRLRRLPGYYRFR
jgi:hypothetical protein